MIMRPIRLAVIAVVLAAAANAPVAAQTNYPQRNVRLIFGFPLGGDVAVRLFTPRFAQALQAGYRRQYDRRRWQHRRRPHRQANSRRRFTNVMSCFRRRSGGENA